MDTASKELIAFECKRIADRTSQSTLAVRCRVSSATMNHVINKKWQNINDSIFRRIDLSLNLNTGWNTAKTQNFLDIIRLHEVSKQRSLAIGIADEAGYGKTHAYSHFWRNYDNVTYIECSKLWTMSQFIAN